MRSGPILGWSTSTPRLKREIVDAGITSGLRYSMAKTAFIRRVLAEHGAAEAPIPIGSTIGILGGGQLGRMLGVAARALGYRVAVLDPDPDCPARAIADRQVVAAYDDTGAALELADGCAVVTFELEHVSALLADAVEERLPLRPGAFALKTTQHRLAERRFLESINAPTAAWREVRSIDDLRDGAAALGYPLRLKAAIGGYDGRSQVRIADLDGPEGIDAAWSALERSPSGPACCSSPSSSSRWSSRSSWAAIWPAAPFRSPPPTTGTMPAS